MLPHIARADNPYEVKDEPKDVSDGATGLIARHPDLPSEAWRETFLRRFRNFRKVGEPSS